MIVILIAGGSGSRLWPMSRTLSPKQFLSLGDTEESLFQETFRRMEPLMEPGLTYIVGSKNHDLEIHQQLEQIQLTLPEKNILLEPKGMNTAPAILWALSQIKEEDYDKPVLIAPADHLIQPEEAFLAYLRQGEKLANQGWLVTFGVKPDRPETGYGYIKAGEALEIGNKVAAFHEKPDLVQAVAYLKEGSYSWNAGIFLSTPRVLLEEFQSYCGELYQCFFPQGKGPNYNLDIAQCYNQVQANSIDYAILEKSQRVATVTFDLQWSDLGSWESIYQIRPKDPQGNVSQGNVILRDSENCLILGQKRLIAGLGLKNMIIVETDDALLVCDMSRAQEVKQLVDQLKQDNRVEFRHHTKVLRPWGTYQILFEQPGIKIKSIRVTPGKRLSLQRHFNRAEHWIVTQGAAVVTRNQETLFLAENESVFIPQTAVHRLENRGKLPLEIIEVQQGKYLGEDDIERLQDDFNRSNEV